MSASPRHRLKYETSGSSNDVEYSSIAEDHHTLLPGPTVSRSDRQLISKRPYRQRRKDPSCDACRERKVKCDASDSGACSECSTRGVPCCFTKESNRRMSSLKQIQDLEERLGRAKQEVIQLRMCLAQRSNESHADLTNRVQRSTLASPQAHDTYDLGTSTVRRDDNMMLFTSASWHRSSTCIYVEELPHKTLTLRLLQSYERELHPQLPIVPVEEIKLEIEKLYQHGKLDHVPQAWRGMLMTILACALQSTSESSTGYASDHFAQLAVASLDQSWSGFQSPDQIRSAILLAWFFFEADLLTASLVWYSIAFTLARQADHNPSFKAGMAEDQSKPLLWLALHWFRLNFLAADLTYSSLPENYLPPYTAASPDVLDNDNLVVQRNLRIMRQLMQAAEPVLIGAHTNSDEVVSLRTFEVSIAMIIGTMPSILDPGSSLSLQRPDVFPAFSIQVVRMLTLLRTLSQSSVGHTILAAQDTVHLVLRLMMEQDPASSLQPSSRIEEVLANDAALFCLHLWRCQMILSLGGRLDSVRTLVRLSSMIGDHRKINRNCATSLSWYLTQLTASVEAGLDTEDDGRLLSLVGQSMSSLQRHIESSSQEAHNAKPATLRRSSSDDTAFGELKDDTHDEDVWVSLDRKLAQLEQAQTRKQAPSRQREAGTMSPPMSAAHSSRSRMQISHIIK